ncbi:hypothetical protein FS749_001045 [Ceratobasidium sp. UAMH 11750]|nr:hypothetical protein FS749_001045 [Ceratobasidium sp. UAMH 11750]
MLTQSSFAGKGVVVGATRRQGLYLVTFNRYWPTHNTVIDTLTGPCPEIWTLFYLEDVELDVYYLYEVQATSYRFQSFILRSPVGDEEP